MADALGGGKHHAGDDASFEDLAENDQKRGNHRDMSFRPHGRGRRIGTQTLT